MPTTTPPLPPLALSAETDPLWEALSPTERPAIALAYAAFNEAVERAGALGVACRSALERQARVEAQHYAFESGRRAVLRLARQAVSDVAAWSRAVPPDTLAAVLAGRTDHGPGTLLGDLVFEVTEGPHQGRIVRGVTVPVPGFNATARHPLTVGELVRTMAQGQGALGWSGRTGPDSDYERQLFQYSSYGDSRDDLGEYLRQSAPRIGQHGPAVFPSGLRLVDAGVSPREDLPDAETVLGLNAEQDARYTAWRAEAHRTLQGVSGQQFAGWDPQDRLLQRHAHDPAVQHMTDLSTTLNDLRRRAAARIRRASTPRAAARRRGRPEGMTLQSLFESSAYAHVRLTALRGTTMKGEEILEMHFYAYEAGESPYRTGRRAWLFFRPTTDAEIRALHAAGRVFFEVPKSMGSDAGRVDLLIADEGARTTIVTGLCGVVCLVKSAKGNGVSRRVLLPSQILVTRGEEEEEEGAD